MSLPVYYCVKLIVGYEMSLPVYYCVKLIVGYEIEIHTQLIMHNRSLTTYTSHGEHIKTTNPIIHVALFLETGHALLLSTHQTLEVCFHEIDTGKRRFKKENDAVLF